MSIIGLFKGKKIRLTAIRDEDIATMEIWYNNVDFLRYFDKLSAIPRNEKYISNFISTMNENNNEFIFAIRPIDSEKIIGVTGFENIQWNNGVGTIFIGIGDENQRGKGIGKEAMALTIDFAFNELNLHKLQLTVLGYNSSAIALYEGLGFIKEGVFREFILRDKKRFDLINYGLLNYEWKNKYL